MHSERTAESMVISENVRKLILEPAPGKGVPENNNEEHPNTVLWLLSECNQQRPTNL